MIPWYIYPWMVCPRVMHWRLSSCWIGRKGQQCALGLGYRRWKSRRPWGAPHGVNTWLEHLSIYLSKHGFGTDPIGKTPVRIILWCPITKMLIKACFLIQPLEQEGMYQKCCISLCSKVFINHFYQMKASPECLNILTYCSKYWVDRLRRTIGRKV